MHIDLFVPLRNFCNALKRLRYCIGTDLASLCGAARLIIGVVALSTTPITLAAYRVELQAPRSVHGLITEFLDLSRYRDRNDIDADQLDFMVAAAPEQVRKLLSTDGYFAPKTTVRVERSGGAPLVHVEVQPGARTSVASLDLKVTGAVQSEAPARVAAVRDQWILKPGAPFRQEDWTRSKEAGLATLRARRYADATMQDAQARVNPEASRADLSATYESGPAFFLGDLNIEGTQRYPSQIIRNISPLRAGEPYDSDRLLELQRAIQRTPYFSNAVVDVTRDRQQAAQAPVVVRVSEFPTQQLRGGVGYTTDTGAHVNGVYSHNNVFGRAWVLESQARIEQRRQLGSLDLSMPPAEGGFINNVHTLFERTTLKGVDLRSRRVGLRRSRSTERDDRSYTLEYYNDQLRQIAGAALPPDTVVQPGSHQALVAGVAWSRRRLDNLLFPREGHAVEVELGAALKGVVTDQTFIRTLVRGQRYFAVAARDVLVLRGELGAVVSKGGNSAIPASLLFRAGGTDSVRGYSYRSIGNDINGTVYPTRYLATGSVEYQHWLNQQWGAAVFYDVGTATDRWADRAFFQGIGGGARWRSPVGIINADLGYGLQRHQIRPHLSLGVSF